MGTESLRQWVKRAEAGAGRAPGVTSEEAAELKRLRRENAELRRANEILKSGVVFLRGRARRPHQVVAFIDAHRDRTTGGLRWGVEPVCHVLEIAPSTYYGAKNRPPSARAIRDADLGPRLVGLWEKNYSVYGRRKLARAARRAGIDAGRDQVARLMRAHGMRGATRAKKWRTTKPDPVAARAPDLVNRRFTASGPDQLWVADFTYCSTWSGVIYLAFVVDVFSRRIVGWKAARSMAAFLVIDALNMAAWTRRHTTLAGLVCHTDAGSPNTPQ